MQGEDGLKILFTATNLPVPANNGQAIRTLSLLQALASEGHELCFVSFALRKIPETLYPLSAWCSDIAIVDQQIHNLSHRSDYLGRALCLLRRRSYSLERFRSEAMRRKLDDYLNATYFDAIIADSIYALVNVPKTEIPVVLNCHNVEHVILDRYARMERNPFRRFYVWREAHLMRGAEKEGCARASAAMACSEHDRQFFHRLHQDLPLFIVPNAVDVNSYALQDSAANGVDQPQTLLFQGGMDWFPNRDAVQFFVSRILPLIRAQLPTVRFVVAGRNPAPEFIQRFSSDKGIEFTGTVPDLRPYLSEAALVVVPLRLGSGTRIKILEAGAAGKAIVSTQVGAEGLDFTPGRDILLADEPLDFANQVVKLLDDPARRDALGRCARARVVACYSQEAVRAGVAQTLASVNVRELLTKPEALKS